MNIQTIIDKIDDKYFDTDNGIVREKIIEIGGAWYYKNLTTESLKQFLKDSLTSMLDEVRKEGIEQSTGGADRYEIPYITMSKLLNIINSHR